ncbi:MAG: DMT family transporter [Desulforegulaceae bacterium]|nr:DMT family transporter [Desulforegulaceae bacterium]
MKTDNKKAIILALITIGSWSTIASAFKLTLKFFPPELMVFYSSGISSLGIFLIAKFKKIKIFNINSRQLLFSAVSGFLNPFLYYLILIKAYDILPAQSAQALNYTWAVTLSIMSFIILKHKPIKKDYFAIIFCYIGVLIIAFEGKSPFSHKIQANGVFLALSSTIIWAFYWIINTKDSLKPEIRLFYNFLAGFFYSIIYISIFKNFQFSIQGFYGSFYIGIFEMGAGFLLWLYAMKLTDNASRIGNLIYLSPVCSLFIIRFVVGEKILFSTIAGLFLIIVSIVIQNFRREKT